MEIERKRGWNGETVLWHVAAEASECRARFPDLNPYLISSWSSSGEVSVPFRINHIVEVDIGWSIKRWSESREEQVKEAA